MLNEKLNIINLSEAYETPWREIRNKVREAYDNFDIAKMCINCKNSQLALGLKDENGEPIYPIKCKGPLTVEGEVEREYGLITTRDKLKEISPLFTDELLDAYDKAVNPINWLSTMLKPGSPLFTPRDYQSMTVACSATRKVLRMGRRCMKEGTLVNMADGTKKAIEKIKPGEYVYSVSEGKLVKNQVLDVMYNGSQIVYMIQTMSGRTLFCTDNHQILTTYGWVSIEQGLKEGISVVRYKNNEFVLDKIIKIEKLGRREVYDLTVMNDHNYLCENIVVHNCGKTFSMIVGIIYKLINEKRINPVTGAQSRYRVLMVAPRVTMIAEVFDNIINMCNEFVEKHITGTRKSPTYEIDFVNGNKFRGIAAGTQGATSVRGQEGDLLYLDECHPKGTKITIWNGEKRNIEELKKGERILSWEPNKNKFVIRRIDEIKQTGIKDVYTYITVSGKKLSCTENHPVLTRDGWKPICEAEELATTKTKKGKYFFESIETVKFKGKEPVYNMTVRGTHTYIADDFIVHNCDFLTAADFNSILAISSSAPNTEVWASSTPIGETNLFKLSQLETYKEFWFPTHVIPHYDDVLDKEYRTMMDETGYLQEILALYGVASSGVFQVRFIEQSIMEGERVFNRDYVTRNRKEFKIIIGVDWNHHEVGTRIVVLGYHIDSGRYYIIEKSRVALEGWTQTLAVEQIVAVNRVYDADFIYVDEGFGSAQVSLLRLFSESQYGKVPPNHPDLKLTYTVAVGFGTSMTLRDPTTGEEFKKNTKQFLVENTADVLSKLQLVLHNEDDYDIISQMKNYIIKSVGPTGAKTYACRDKKIGDHDLDALMLALYGFHKEFSEFSIKSSLGRLMGVDNILGGQGAIANNSSILYSDVQLSSSPIMVINSSQRLLNSRFNKERRQVRSRRRTW